MLWLGMYAGVAVTENSGDAPKKFSEELVYEPAAVARGMSPKQVKSTNDVQDMETK